jgi:hypothetical protein
MLPSTGLKESGDVISVTIKSIKEPAGIVVRKLLPLNPSISLLLLERSISNLTSYLFWDSSHGISPVNQKDVPKHLDLSVNLTPKGRMRVILSPFS